MRRKKILAIVLSLTFSGFADAQPLDYYLKRGIENSPLLKEFNNQLLSGALDSLLTDATYKPQINQVSQALYAPVGKNLGYDEAITNGGNFSALVNLVQPLLNKRIKEGQFRDISLANQAIGVNAKLTETDLRLGITAQYLTAYADFQQILLFQTTLKMLNEEQEILKSLVDQGIYFQTDRMNMALAITNQENAIKQGTIQYKNDLGLLNFICGITDHPDAVLEKPEMMLRSTFDINDSPAMMKFRIDSLKNINSRHLIDLNYRPKLNVVADAGFMAFAPENIPHNFGTSFGLNFALPIYDGKQRKLQHDKTLLTENSRMNYRHFYSSQYRQRLSQLTEQLNLMDELISGIRNQLSEQEKLIAIYKVEITKGLVRFIDFLATVNNYTQTKNSLTASEMNRLQIINQMNYLK